jgi:hypothetical protein
VRVSTAHGCAFRRDAQGAAATALGLGDLDAPTGDAPPARPAPVLAFVDKLDRTPDAFNEADRRAVLDAGFDETVLHQAALVWGSVNLMNRWGEGLGHPSAPELTRAAGRLRARARRRLGQRPHPADARADGRARLRRLDLVAHDIGGGVAQLMAVRRAERIAKPALADRVCFETWPIPEFQPLQEPGAEDRTSLDTLLAMRRRFCSATITVTGVLPNQWSRRGPIAKAPAAEPPTAPP